MTWNAARRMAWAILLLLAFAMPGWPVQAAPGLEPCHGHAAAQGDHHAPCPASPADVACCSTASCAIPPAVLPAVVYLAVPAAAIPAARPRAGGPGIAFPPDPGPPRTA